MGSLNKNGGLPVGVTGTPDVFCASGHDVYAYRMSFMYVHVGGGAWIFNILGCDIKSDGNALNSYGQEGIGKNCKKFHANPTYRSEDIKYFNLKEHCLVVISQNFAQSPRC